MSFRPPTLRSSYSAGHFGLEIDGHETTAYVKSVEGGHVRRNVIDEPFGADVMRVKHTSTSEIEPLTLEVGMSGATEVLQWIQASWKKEFSRRSGQVTHYDFNQVPTFEHEFMDALITETTFPTLDGASKEAAYLKIKFQAEEVKTREAMGLGRALNSAMSQVLGVSAGKYMGIGAQAASGEGGAKNVATSQAMQNNTVRRVAANVQRNQKSWLPSSFRLSIDGINEIKYANKIDSFTIKQGIKKLHTGKEEFPQIEPLKVEFPRITGTISLDYADSLRKWHADNNTQRTGSLEYLTPDGNETLLQLNLFEVGLNNFEIMPSTSSSDTIKRAKFEIYVGRMEIDGGNLGSAIGRRAGNALGGALGGAGNSIGGTVGGKAGGGGKLDF